MAVKRNIIPIFIPHLGCPHDCVFCNQRKISGQIKPATADMVTELIKDGLKKVSGGDVQVAFYGGSFTAIAAEDQEKLMNAALPFLNSKMISSLRISTRPDCIDGDVIKRLIKYGVRTVELGVQSMDADVLLKSNRGHTPEDAVRSTVMLKKAGLEVILQMMTGLPGDTKERSLYTARELIKLQPDGVRIYPTVIISDTALCDLWKIGAYKEHTVEEAADWCAEISELFNESNIPIIRLGLNPTEDLSNGEAIAGAYHPALGEIVKSKMYLNKMYALLKDISETDEISFEIAKGQMSQAVGQHRSNVKKLQNKFGIKKVKFFETDIAAGEIRVLNIAKID